MSDATAIEWTDTTWNPVRGCSKVSVGCKNCYAERTAARQVHGAYRGLVVGGRGSRHIDWIIVGGESGPGARPCDVSWIRSVVEQCKAAGVPCFVKQLGAVSESRDPVINGDRVRGYQVTPSGLRDRKGGDPDEWPLDLRVREFPEART